jgi:UDP-N-acetylmuramate--alanine ligase
MNSPHTSLFAEKTQAGQRLERLKAPPKPALAGKRYHFIGAGGIGMSGLAKVLLKHDAVVSGSDQTRSNITENLCNLGADIEPGHSSENLPDRTDTVVISAAIKQDNPELVTARRLSCEIKKYAQMLGELMNYYDGIAIAGTHGKSTTSGWLSYILHQAGLEPNFIVGAKITQLGDSSGTGAGSLFVAEACEYDRSFLNLKPKIACILNIEADHLDYYKNIDEIIDAFCDFAKGTRDDGTLIVNADDQNIRKVILKLPYGITCRTFGLDAGWDFSVRNIKWQDGLYHFEVLHQGFLAGQAQISLPGRHNILNALAVIAAADAAGVPIKKTLQLLPKFTGIERRLMFKGKINDITVIDDYAHHPTEIRASLQAVRQKYQPKRLWCIFQPHQYSRTRFLLDDFAESFKLADITIVPEIYFVRDSQEAEKEINAKVLVDRLKGNHTEALFIDNFDEIVNHLKDNVKPGELVVTMGAGDIWKVADGFFQRVGENR